MSATDPVGILQEWAQGGPLNQVSISDDGSQLVKDGQAPLNATTKVTFTHGDKTCEYTLASIFLQILDPSQGLKDYRAACKKYKVSDPVKALDKATVVGFFLGAQAEEPSADAPADFTAVASSTTITGDVDAGIADDVAVDTSATGAAAQPSEGGAPRSSKSRDKDRRPASSSSDKHRSRDRERHHRHDKKRSHSSSSAPSSSSALKSEEKKRKAPKTINTETLFSNLVTVVDKRSNAAQKQKREETAQLMAALSTEGFEITQELLSQYKSRTEAIIANEIPVGNSASILKAAAGKDLSRILQMYLEVIQPSTNSTSTGGKSASSGTNALGQKKTWRTHLVGQKPVIIVPKGMTAPITMLNAHEFFGNSRFVPREVMMKKGFHKTNIPSTFSRRVGQRLGGGMVTYEIMDNPKVKLPTAKDWDRVVAVLCLGQGWQFKDWPGHYSDPVRLFSCVYGFYTGMEGAKIPPELESWAVTKAKLNRDKRGLDSVTYASFWNGLDEFMAIHKPEMLPQPEAS